MVFSSNKANNELFSLLFEKVLGYRTIGVATHQYHDGCFFPVQVCCVYKMTGPHYSFRHALALC